MAFINNIFEAFKGKNSMRAIIAIVSILFAFGYTIAITFIPIPEPNIILHLKCGQADLVQNNFLSGITYEPNVPSVETFQFESNKGGELNYQIINNDTNMADQTFQYNILPNTDILNNNIHNTIHNNNTINNHDNTSNNVYLNPFLFTLNDLMIERIFSILSIPLQNGTGCMIL
jgi:hypothetical protein